METLMFFVLVFIAVCQAACLVLLILIAKKKEENPEEPEPVKPDEYQDYLEKLWQEGLNGIMSYGISNAAGKRRSDE